MKEVKTIKRFIAILLAATLVLVFFVACWLVLVNYNNHMKSELQRLAQLMAESLNGDMIKGLTGTKADLKSKSYKELKRILTEHKASIPQCRLVYLLGENKNGNIFFYVDSEPDYSTLYSPPGDIYTKATDDLVSAFTHGYPFVEGPVKGNQGERVSAIAPVRDSAAGKIITVLGVDVDASDWRVAVFFNSALPIGLMLIILIGLLTVIYMSVRKEGEPRHVMRSLLLPMCIVVIVLVAGSVIMLLHLYRLNLNKRIKLINDTISGGLAINLNSQGNGLAETLESLSMTPSIQATSFASVSKDELLKRWSPLFDRLQEKNIEIMAFYNDKRECILRMQSSKIKNNELNLASFLKAEKSKQPVFGLELIDGELTLRALQPIVKNGKVDGYMELGKDIDKILETKHELTGCMLIVLAKKRLMNRANWEIQMHESKIMTHWDLLPDDVVVYTSSSLNKGDSELLAHIQSYGTSRFDKSLKYDNKTWRTGINYIYDSSGNKIAEIIALTDTTASLDELHEIAFTGSALGGALLIGLLAFIVVLLRHTDAAISAQQAGLHDSKERLSATLHSIGEGVISVDGAGSIVEMNSQAEKLTGLDAEDAIGCRFDKICCIIDSNESGRKINPAAVALRGEVSECYEPRFSLLSRNGREYLITYCCTPVYDREDVVAGAVMVFRDMTVEHNRRQQLQDSEARFNILSDQGRVLVWEGDKDGLYTYVSDSAEKVLGYSSDEMVGIMHFYDLHPEDGRQEYMDEAFKLVSRKEAFKESLHQVQTKSGGIIWMSSFGIPIFDENGELLGYRGISRDVTEEKMMDDKLKESEENYRIIFENSQVGTYKTRETDGVMVECNDRCANILGYDTRSELLEDYDFNKVFVNPSDRENLVDQLKENGRVDNYELALYKQDGNIVWLEISLSLYREYIMGAMSDITERVHMKMYNELYIDCMDILNSSKNLDAAMNKVVAELLKVSSCDAAGIRLQNGDDFPYFSQSGFSNDFIATENAILRQSETGDIKRNSGWGAKLDCFCGMVITGKTIPNNPLFTAEGSLWSNNAIEALEHLKSKLSGHHFRNACIHCRYRSIAMVPIKFKSNIVGLIQLSSKRKGLFTLIAIQKLEQIAAHIGIALHRQEEEYILRDALSQAHVATTAKNQFMANMSHEMRTPLNGIIGSSEILQDTPLTDDQKQYVSVIKKSGDKMLNMIDDILYAAKATGGGIKVISEPVGIKRLIHNSISQLKTEAEDKKIDFSIDIATDIPDTLLGDSAHIALILKHLCSNAVKFTKKGKISVDCSVFEKDDEVMHIKFVVKDTGVGIKDDKLAHLFEPFNQADDSDKRQFGGAGLGLAICKHMISILGGTLDIKSTSGKGTTCTFIIPMLIPANV